MSQAPPYTLISFVLEFTELSCLAHFFLHCIIIFRRLYFRRFCVKKKCIPLADNQLKVLQLAAKWEPAR